MKTYKSFEKRSVSLKVSLVCLFALSLGACVGPEKLEQPEPFKAEKLAAIDDEKPLTSEDVSKGMGAEEGKSASTVPAGEKDPNGKDVKKDDVPFEEMRGEKVSFDVTYEKDEVDLFSEVENKVKKEQEEIEKFKEQDLALEQEIELLIKSNETKKEQDKLAEQTRLDIENKAKLQELIAEQELEEEEKARIQKELEEEGFFDSEFVNWNGLDE